MDIFFARSVCCYSVNYVAHRKSLAMHVLIFRVYFNFRLFFSFSLSHSVYIYLYYLYMATSCRRFLCREYRLCLFRSRFYIYGFFRVVSFFWVWVPLFERVVKKKVQCRRRNKNGFGYMGVIVSWCPSQRHTDSTCCCSLSFFYYIVCLFVWLTFEWEKNTLHDQMIWCRVYIFFSFAAHNIRLWLWCAKCTVGKLHDTFFRLAFYILLYRFCWYLYDLYLNHIEEIHRCCMTRTQYFMALR